MVPQSHAAATAAAAEAPTDTTPRRSSRLVWVLLVAAVLVTGSFFLWAGDTITLQGERTVYTADCRDGAWQGRHCTGTMVAGPRYRFRALKAHREVLFWVVGESGRSGKFSDCEISDGRNWTCKPGADAGQTITTRMTRGVPAAAADAGTRPFHTLTKLHWWLRQKGLRIGSDADT